MSEQNDALLADASGAASPSLAAALWSLLQSVRTTIYVLPMLAVATTIGAVVPQARPTAYYDAVYGRFWGSLVTRLGLDDIYNSTWFIGLACILLLNLAACVGRSLRRAARRYRGPAPETLARKLQGSTSHWCAEANGVDAERLSTALRRARFAVTEHSGPKGESWLLVRRWPLAHYGGIVTHLAIFLVAIGAVLGRLPWTSLDRQITIAEGETYSDPDGRLGFDVRLDEFRMDFYEGTNQPSSYESDIVLLSGGREVKKGTATVNTQLVYNGVALGQAQWGLAGVRLLVTGDGGKTQTVEMPLMEAPGPHGDPIWDFAEDGRIAMLRDGKSALVGVQFVPDAQGGSSYPKSPTVALQLVTGLDAGRHDFVDLGVLRAGEERAKGGYRVRFEDLTYVSTLSARKDPGLPLVWVGFILVSLGMTVMFYVRPRTFLVEVAAGRKGDSVVRVAPAERELAEADRRIIESACGAPLLPAGVKSERHGQRRQRS